MSNSTKSERQRDGWDDAGELRQGRKTASVVMSVRFSPSELSAIRAAARKKDQSTSEFIRTAALDRVAGEARSASLELTFTAGAIGSSIRPVATETSHRGPTVKGQRIEPASVAS